MPNTIDGQYILYVLLIFSFLSDIFPENTAASGTNLFRHASPVRLRPVSETRTDCLKKAVRPFVREGCGQYFSASVKSLSAVKVSCV